MPAVRGPIFAMGGTWRLNSAPGDHPVDPFDGRAIEALGHDLVDRQSPVHEPEEDAVDLGVREPDLGLVGLARPQVRGGCLAEDRVGHADRGGHLPDLALVEVADRVERAGAVAPERGVADEGLGLVAGADHEATPRDRAVVEHHHPGPRHEVAASQGGRVAALFGR